MKDFVYYNDLNHVMDECFNNKDLEYIAKRVATGNSRIEESLRKEVVFFKNFENIVNSVEQRMDLRLQFKVGGYSVDGAILETFDNCGDIDKDKEKYTILHLIEFDEDHHEYQKEKDNARLLDIINTLDSECAELYDFVNIYRVNEHDSNEFLMYAIPFFSNIETSFSLERLNEKFLVYTK